MPNCSRYQRRTGPTALQMRLRRFATRDDGSIAVLSVFVFFAMLLVGGLAIDMTRHENERIRMQNTADRAVLAATMQRENAAGATPQQIVASYFAAEGLSAQLAGNISVVDDPDAGRTVTVAPVGTVPTLFMSLLGIDDFAVTTPAQAAEALGARTRVELVMVLDVSGSMGSDDKISSMRTAAASLVSTLLADATDDEVAITIVPYSTWVLPPAGFLNGFSNVSGSSGACNDWTQWNVITNSLSQATARRSCSTDAWRTVRPFVRDPVEAALRIQNLRASGTTSIDLGVRYGSLFFDPSLQPVISQLIVNGTVDPVFEGRPFDWDEPNVVRAMILLTDGQNCCGARYSNAQQDANAIAVCTELKGMGILVYSIAFQAPSAGASLMQACASSPSHYFNADTSELISVFQGIGANIQTQALRLTF